MRHGKENAACNAEGAIEPAEQEVMEALFGPEDEQPALVCLGKTLIVLSPLDPAEGTDPRPAPAPIRSGSPGGAGRAGILRSRGIRPGASRRRSALGSPRESPSRFWPRLLGWFFGPGPARLLARHGKILGLGGLVICGFWTNPWFEGCESANALGVRASSLHDPGQVDARGDALSYGLGKVSVRCERMAAFGFSYTTGKVAVQYAVGGIQGKRDLAIQLNGVLLGYAPVTLDRWSAPLPLSIPRRFLKANARNEIAFVHLANDSQPLALAHWGVKLFSVQETPLPQPDPVQGRSALVLAKQLYRNREVAPANLYRAWERFSEARDLLEQHPDRDLLPLFQEAQEMASKLEVDLNRQFRFLLFSAEQALVFRRVTRAKDCYRQILLFFPNVEDSRHRRANELLSSLGSSVNQ